MRIAPTSSIPAHAPHDLRRVTVTGPADNILQGITVAHDNTVGIGDERPTRTVDVYA